MTGDAELAPGTPFGRFRVLSVIGRGGMGVVYRARQPELERDVALKVMGLRAARDPAFQERFRTEAVMTAAVEHPGIVPVYEAGEVDGVPYLAVRYADGTDLRRLIEAGPLPPERALDILEPVAAALDAAHRRGLIHGDVKPANILVGDEGDPDIVYLSDFGLARGFATAGEGGDRWSGTAEYVAPEVLTGEAVDGRADLYALAAVLHEALTGRPPFTGADEVAVLLAQAEVPPPTASDLRPGLGAALDAVLRRGLAKVPAERPESCTALLEDARAALAAVGRAVPPPTPLEAAHDGTPPPTSSPPAPGTIAPVPTLVDARSPARRRRVRPSGVRPAYVAGGVAVVTAAAVLLLRVV